MGNLSDNPTQEERVVKFVDGLQKLADETGITIAVLQGQPMILQDLESKQIIHVNVTVEDDEEETQ